MKTKLLIIAFVAITLLSFTVVSSKKNSTDKSQSSKETSESGFALQDRDQF
jgi:hypothetical protein